ncbi:hypothetical protein [Isoptericola sp. NPDC057391]
MPDRPQYRPGDVEQHVEQHDEQHDDDAGAATPPPTAEENP